MDLSSTNKNDIPVDGTMIFQDEEQNESLIKEASSEAISDTTVWIKEEKDDSVIYEDETEVAPQRDVEEVECGENSNGIKEVGPTSEGADEGSLLLRIKSEDNGQMECHITSIKDESVDLVDPSTSGGCEQDNDDSSVSGDSEDSVAATMKEDDDDDIPTKYLIPHVKVECEEENDDLLVSRGRKGSGSRGNFYLLHGIAPSPIRISLIKKYRCKSLRCPYCKYRCKEMETLGSHIRENHLSKIQFCEYGCGWSTVLPRTITRHIMEKHTFERPYACPYCPEAFVCPNPLRKHMVDHDTSRPHLCDHCDHVASSAYGLKAHVLALHRQKKNVFMPEL